MLHAVIMAGGSGTRFWPASRDETPKQLLNLLGERSMIQATVDRLGELVTSDRMLVVTGERLVEAIKAQLPDLPAKAIIGEPCRRDTAPCIGLAANAVSLNDPDATMVVMPADHVIKPDDAFQKAIKQAAELIDKHPKRIITFGIKPTYPAQSFGYIERGEPLAAAKGYYEVVRFREKPDAETAKEFVEAGNYFWNSGIFVWKARTILDALRENELEMYEHLACIDAAWGGDKFQDVFRSEFEAIKGVSIDYAVMEHAKEIVVAEAPFEWDDLGSWQSIARLRGADADGNTIVGRHLGIDTKGTIVRTDDEHLIVTLGLEDCIVVHTKGATLVARKDQEEAIRKVVERLEEKEWTQYL